MYILLGKGERRLCENLGVFTQKFLVGHGEAQNRVGRPARMILESERKDYDKGIGF